MNERTRESGTPESQGIKVGAMLAYQGKADCQSPICRAIATDTGWKCQGWHCAVCHKPSSYQGHTDCAKEAGIL